MTRPERKELERQIYRLKAKSTRLEAALTDSADLAADLYEHIQRGAGCCGEAIGRGSRVRQVEEDIRHQLALVRKDYP